MPYSGKYTPKNPSKYKGDPLNIIYRSNWERRVMKFLDENKNCIWWASEEMPIPYRSPVDQKVHRYFPDFIARMKQKNGTEKTLMLEVKPEKQTKLPTQKRRTQTFLRETVAYAVNQEKWRAADLFCKEHGWEFMLITEKELGI
jgi:hypothetical protein